MNARATWFMAEPFPTCQKTDGEKLGPADKRRCNVRERSRLRRPPGMGDHFRIVPHAMKRLRRENQCGLCDYCNPRPDEPLFLFAWHVWRVCPHQPKFSLHCSKAEEEYVGDGRENVREDLRDIGRARD